MPKCKRTLLLLCLLACAPVNVLAQEATSETNPTPTPTAEAGPPRQELKGQPLNFNAESFVPPADSNVLEVLWDFGDGIRTTGQEVSHTYAKTGSYLVTLRITTETDSFTDTTEVRIFDHLVILVADSSAPADQLELHRTQAAKNSVLLLIVQPQSRGPEVVTEEALTTQLLDIRTDLQDAHTIVLWTSGGVGANVLTKLAQNFRQAGRQSPEEAALHEKGIVLLSETPFAVLKPAAQPMFDQLQPRYVILARPAALDLITATTSADEVREIMVASPLEYRLLGTFSTRTVSDLRITNFMSFGINFLINRGVPVGSLILILMLPVIATIIAFARQVIGLKAFGLLTPAMTCVSFLVMGLRYGLVVFFTILLAGTATRFILRRLRLLYLPRMALVLTSVSLALLLLLGIGTATATDRASVISFSIFPALILTILAEDFIAAQFKSGPRTALTVSAWTLALATVCYLIDRKS